MSVDVETRMLIARPKGQVASFASDPSNAPAWYVNIKSVRWHGEPTVAVGARIDFEAQFLGRQLSYTYEIREYEPGEVLRMSTEEGPFPMETTYRWSEVKPDVTMMTLRNRGTPSGFGRVAAPVMKAAMKRANAADLRKLKALLEKGVGQ